MYIAIFVLVVVLDICKAIYSKLHNHGNFTHTFVYESKKDLYFTFIKVLNPMRFILWVISLI